MSGGKLSHTKAQKSLLKKFFWFIFISIILLLLLYRLNSWPSLWWDEGWTLDAARNWIVHGHLGHYLDGIPITARSPVRFPVAVAAALSMKIFGVGIWQGRLPGVIFTLLALFLVYYLTSRIYNKTVGLATLIILIFLSPLLINTVVMGRQVLAEMPMLFYLLAGYTMVWLALNHHAKWSICAVIFFGVSLNAKLQVPPFWLISFILGIGLAIALHQRRALKILVGIAIGSIVLAVIILFFQNIYMPGSISDPALISILFNTAVIVLSIPVRVSALITIGLYALPPLIGFLWAGVKLFRSSIILSKKNLESENPGKINIQIVAFSLWGLGIGWFLWYLFMAMFWARYLFPPYFIGCIFFAEYLAEISGGFDLRLFVRRSSGFLFYRQPRGVNFQALILLIALSILLGSTIKGLQISFTTNPPDPISASGYLKNIIPYRSRVESFESELFFLAPEIKFHYPSDLVSMQLVRKFTVDPYTVIQYDPLVSNPDYLVIGPYARTWYLYDEKMIEEKFDLISTIGDYDIYRIKSKIVSRLGIH